MNDRDFKGVWIPKSVWLDDRLNMLEKGILIEIDSLDRSDDGCWASNEYLASFCQCSVTKVATAVTKLVNLGYLRRESFDGRKRKMKSCLSFFERQTFKDLKPDVQKMNESNTNKKSNKYTTRKGNDTDDFPIGFTEFWSLYPRKVVKKTAAKAWSKTGAPDSKQLTNTILADIRRRLEGEWKGKDIQYIPHPTTYLNQRRWEDEVSGYQKEEEFVPLYESLSVDEIMRRSMGE